MDKVTLFLSNVPSVKIWSCNALRVLFREKKLLVNSDDYGRDLTGVENLKRKHKRLEGELMSHEPAIQAVQDAAAKLMTESNLGVPEIEQRLNGLDQAWFELKEVRVRSICSSRFLPRNF